MTYIEALRKACHEPAQARLPAPPPAVSSASSAPELVLEALEGKKRSLAELRGRVVVVEFWATWCMPCRAQMPVLVRLDQLEFPW